MARRHLTITMTVTIDEDLARDAQTPLAPDGHSHYDDVIDELRTTVHHETGRILAALDPDLEAASVAYTGIDFGDSLPIPTNPDGSTDWPAFSRRVLALGRD
jgi:hypothetical protein